MRFSHAYEIRRGVVWMLSAVLLTGCFTTYRYSYEPSVRGEAKTQGRYCLRSWRVECGEGEQASDGRLDSEVCLDVNSIRSARPDVFSDAGVPVDVVACVDGSKTKYSAVGISGIGMLVTLGLFPCWNHWDSGARIRVVAGEGENRTESEFELAMELRESLSSSGLNLLLPYRQRTGVRFSSAGSDCRGISKAQAVKKARMIEAYAYAVVATLAQMERNGKLSIGLKPSLGSGRRTEILQLYEAGVLSADEYQREMERLKRADGK